jgi:hypothetical protein
MRLAVIVVVGVFAAACATPAPNDASTAAAQSDKVCKRMVATGSNMPQNVCHTKEEWAAMDKQGRQDVEDFERARSEVNPVGP